MNQETDIMQRTKTARKKTGLSQTDFAKKIGMERSSYNKYETRSPIARDKIPLFCELTGVTEKWLLTGEDSDSDPEKSEFLREAEKAYEAAKGKDAEILKAMIKKWAGE